MISAPPRHGKSELASRCFPAWFLGRNPDRRVISTSYNGDMATDFGKNVRDIVGSREYGALFPAVRLSPDSQAKNKWDVTGGWRGGYVAAGVEGGITGKGANCFIIDDPHKSRAEAEQPGQRDAVWEWYRGDVLNRLDGDGAIVLIMTRWHEDDMVGRLEAIAAEGGTKWEKVVFPASFSDDGTAVPPDAEGATALWPQRFPLPLLVEKRRDIGPYNWSSEYDQRPRPLGGSFFQETDLLVDGAPVALPLRYENVTPRPDYVFATIDTAVKTGKEHDGLAVCYSAVAKHKQWPFPLVTLDWELTQLEGASLERWLPTVFARLEELAVLVGARLGSAGAWIEDKTSGTILLQQAKNNGWQAHPIETKLTAMGKSERAIDASPYVTSGKVKLGRWLIGGSPLGAYDRVATYKGTTKNHLLSQVLGFRPGSGDMGADDLLDAWTYSIAIGLGNAKGF